MCNKYVAVNTFYGNYIGCWKVSNRGTCEGKLSAAVKPVDAHHKTPRAIY